MTDDYISHALGLSVPINELDAEALSALVTQLTGHALTLIQRFGTGQGRWQSSEPPQPDDADIVIAGLIVVAQLAQHKP